MEALVVGEAYRDANWPHGLRCGQCRRIFSEAERYVAQPDACVEDALLTKIVCLACFGLDECR